MYYNRRYSDMIEVLEGFFVVVIIVALFVIASVVVVSVFKDQR